MSPLFLGSAMGILALFFFYGLFFSGKASSSSEYAVAERKATAGGVSGVILGALVGGGSTVGTVQLAYTWGVSAWWFTLGGGIGCLIMGLWFINPLRRTQLVTLPQFLGSHYGPSTALLGALATGIGSFLSLIAQFLAGTALLGSIFPFPLWGNVLFLSALILVFAFGGGIKSFSRLGWAKIVFLYTVMILCAGRVLLQGHTPGTLAASLSFDPYLNLFARGAGKDLGAFFSLLAGVLCGQIYIQAVYTASSEDTARKGFLMTSLITPPLGLLGVWIGLAMRNSGVVVEGAQALPFFIKNYFNPLLGGFLWSGIMITVLGTAVGVTFGVATNLTRDIYLKTRRAAEYDDARILLASRVIVLIVVAVGGIITLGTGQTLILSWAYFGQGIKGAAILVPLVAAVFRPGVLLPRVSFLSGAGGLAGVVLGALFLKGIDPLFPGLALSGIIALAGMATGAKGLPDGR